MLTVKEAEDFILRNRNRKVKYCDGRLGTIVGYELCDSRDLSLGVDKYIMSRDDGGGHGAGGPKWDRFFLPFKPMTLWYIGLKEGPTPTGTFEFVDPPVDDAGILKGPAKKPDATLTSFPHVCPQCKGPAYVGFSDVDCMKKCGG